MSQHPRPVALARWARPADRTDKPLYRNNIIY